MGIEGTPVLDVLRQQLPPVDPRSLAGTACLGLPGRPESVRSAREFTRSTLHGWRLPEQFDAVGLVVSELVTNALRHGVRTRPAAAGRLRASVELELMRCSRRLVCAVRDPGEAVPRLGRPDCSAESGRGLQLVESFSDAWGWRPLSGERPGKVVWAAFRTC
ncbi:ATP-binding protein [Streptomyces sodiiphilus]|uniref:ATP-binding protein n=1 Tax=Streptomyces sodiiphilus TaxID=226217 RepID=A0ABP5B448_9ACTN